MSVRLVERPSPNCDARRRPIDLVVLHYTGMQSAEVALARLTDPDPRAGRYPGPWQPAETPPDAPLGKVSAHYVIDEGGTCHRLVPEAVRAWHAGVSFWAGLEAVNDNAIGIELVNGGHDFGLPPFPAAQTDALCALLADILARHGLGPHRVVGHSDVAPGRKLDPGERFPWARLAAAGLALAPRLDLGRPAVTLFAPGAEGAGVAAFQEGLAGLGYGVQPTGVFDAATAAVVTAFHRRFRPDHLRPEVDETTLDLIADLLDQTARLNLKRLQS